MSKQNEHHLTRILRQGKNPRYSPKPNEDDTAKEIIGDGATSKRLVYFFKVDDYFYHPIPSFTIDQENFQMYNFRLKGTLVLRKYSFEDGSQLRCFRSRFGDTYLKQLFGKHTDFGYDILDQQEALTKEKLGVLLRSFSGKLTYQLIAIHRFLDSWRILPILSYPLGKMFWDLSVLFPALRPEDNLGVLIPEISEAQDMLEIEGITSSITYYLANIRICNCCFRMMDFRQVFSEKGIMLRKTDIARSQKLKL